MMLSWQVKLFYFILQDTSIMAHAYKESGTNYDPSLALITWLGGGHDEDERRWEMVVG